jgi:hypothetical protein
MLWFIIPFNVLVTILREWLPWHFAMRMSCLVAGLVAFRVRGLHLRNYGFGKYLIYVLFVSAGFSILAFAMEALVSALFR